MLVPVWGEAVQWGPMNKFEQVSNGGQQISLAVGCCRGRSPFSMSGGGWGWGSPCLMSGGYTRAMAVWLGPGGMCPVQ